MAIGEKLIKIRETLGFKQIEFAEKLGITPKTLREWEKEKHTVKFEILIQLVKEYKVNPLYFFDDDEEILAKTSPSSSKKLLKQQFELDAKETELVTKLIEIIKKEDIKSIFKEL